jgi:hypothetical protein
MDVSSKPMETINQWQDWYRKHRVVAELDAPGVSKDSRENLHDTTNATDTMPDWRSHYKALIEEDANNPNAIYMRKVTEHFADTLCEFQNELTGEQFYNCFLAAALDINKSAKEEYDKTKQLVDILLIKNKETGSVS